MDPKIIFAVVSILLGTYAFFPYLRDTIRGKTQPHSYTWLIWSLTQGTAAFGIFYGGGGIGGLAFAIGAVFVFITFLFSLKYGTKNITSFDTILLIVALLAIFLWWYFKDPFISVLLVCIIDIVGYFPSFRKSYQEPWSETLLAWGCFIVGNSFALLALREYNFLTMGYIISISVANLLLILICVVRRKSIARPQM